MNLLLEQFYSEIPLARPAAPNGICECKYRIKAGIMKRSSWRCRVERRDGNPSNRPFSKTPNHGGINSIHQELTRNGGGTGDGGPGPRKPPANRGKILTFSPRKAVASNALGEGKIGAVFSGR
jgi:hypothetical protein